MIYSGSFQRNALAWEKEEKTMKLENEVLSVEIAELGAEVTGISDREKNTDILWEGNPSFSRMSEKHMGTRC